MAAHAGESARKTGDFRCESWREQVPVTRDKKAPNRPNCGDDTVDSRYHEPGDKSS